MSSPNGRSIIHKGSGDKAVAGPDVCKTPIGNAVIPVPYPNIAESSDLENGSKSVEINGQSVMLKGSTLKSSCGDEAGRLGGIISGVSGKEIEAILYSANVKIEGRNVVRHMDNTFHNKKNTMGTIYGSSASASNPFKSPEPKKYKCAWEKCEGNHPFEVNYKNDGCTKRGEYTGTWLEPWSNKKRGAQSNKITNAHYEDERSKEIFHKEAKSLLASGWPKYVINNHHLIPIAAMAKFPELRHNAKLVGWDINNSKCGIYLPYFITDIFRHDLQSHKTTHRSYSFKVEKQLQVIEQESLKYCSNSEQYQLVNKLDELSERLRKHIGNWNKAWLLRKTAVNDRQKSFKQAGLPHP